MATRWSRHRSVVGFGIGVLGLGFTIVVALALPSRTADASCRLDCNARVNGAKIALIALGLLVVLAGMLVGAFRSYVDKS